MEDTFSDSLPQPLNHGPALILVTACGDMNTESVQYIRDHSGAGNDIRLALMSHDRFELINWEPANPTNTFTGMAKPVGATNPSRIGYDENLIIMLLNLLNKGDYQILFSPSYSSKHTNHATLALIAREAVRRTAGRCKLVTYASLDSNATLVYPGSDADLTLNGPQVNEQIFTVEALYDHQCAPKAYKYELNEVKDFIRPVSGASLNLSIPRNPRADQPLVSVIIRSTNRPELADALDSVATQTYPVIEVIVVDVNGKKNFDFGLHCGSFPIKIASTGSHLGRSAAANIGLQKAQGNYAIFLDDDDWFLPNHIATLANLLTEQRVFNAAYAGVDCLKFDESGEWSLLHTFNKTYEPVHLLLENYIPIHAVLFDRSVIGNNLRFDERLDVYEDWDFWIQLSQKTYFLHVDQISAIYRIGGSSGFGVQADSASIHASLLSFFDKWRHLWTLDQILAIRQYSVEHDLRRLSHPIDSSQNALIEQIEHGLTRLSPGPAKSQADIIQNLVILTKHLRHSSEDLHCAWEQAKEQLNYSQSKLLADRISIERLFSECIHLNEKNKVISALLAKSQDHVRVIELAHKNDLLNFFEIQRNPFWPLFMRLHQFGFHQRKFAHLIISASKVMIWSLTFRLPSSLRRRAICNRLINSGLFDERWYILNYPEVLFSGYRPVMHWLMHGWRQGFNPQPLFRTQWYLERNPDVAKAGINPLVHFLNIGGEEGRDPHPLFDSDWYLQQNPDVAAASINPLSHFVTQGYHEGRSPHPLFDLNWYLLKYPDVAASGINPLVHFVEYGQLEGRLPNPFSTSNDSNLTERSILTDSEPSREKKTQDNIVLMVESFDGSMLQAQNNLSLKGWLIVSCGIDQAQVLIDGKPCATLICTIERLDVVALYPDIADGSFCGFDLEIDVTAFIPGEHALMIKVRSCQGCELIRTIPLLIHNVSALSQDVSLTTYPQIEIIPPAMIILTKDSVDQEVDDIAFKRTTTPEISILIPVFNQVRFTLCCLKSIAAHPPKAAIEIIVIDDASTDETQRLIGRVQGITYIRNEANLGFLRSVNRAARLARGSYLHLLNNDTQVQSGWLDALLAAFREEPGTGIVGSKLIYPSGHLQEAGADLKRDGKVELIGLNDHPLLPAYNTRRRVDHCSGASILIEKELFDHLGGLEQAYAPAYFEDCDLSLRVMAMGRYVVYEPKSVVIHHLSVSTATQPGEKMSLIAHNRDIHLARWQTTLADLDAVRLIAFFLPQFHPIPENDQWWGKGFTEWTNVTRAKPNFVGHQQPILPADLGFYDLRLPEVRQVQADLARRYGIYGFCYYNYWFNGHRLLNQPIDAILASGEPNFPFCICWANENWTRRWDGGDDQILIGQDYSESDNLAYIQHLDPWLRDRRYIRVNGRPMLLVYRVELLPNPSRTAKIWREYCHAAGIGEIYLAMVESFDTGLNPKMIGFDAAIEFPPHMRAVELENQVEITNQNFNGMIYDYPATAANFKSRPLPDYPLFRTAMPSWDNTPRRQNNSHIFVNSSPADYEQWLKFLVSQTRMMKQPDERIIFINAWNEWAEGNHLEPDQIYGHAYLEATRRALDNLIPPGYGGEEISAATDADVGTEHSSRFQPSTVPLANQNSNQSTRIKSRKITGDSSFLPTVDSTLPPGALLVGHPYAVLGRAEDIRTAACACHAASIPFAMRNLFGDYGRQWSSLHRDFPLMHRVDPGASFRANLFILNANEMESVPQQLGHQFMSGHYNIGYWAWELSIFPDAWLTALEGLHEIWAPSRFIQSALEAKVPCPVTWMPLAVEPGFGPMVCRRDLGLPEHRFIFLFFFDFRSFVSRKNPLAVIQAFRQAFPMGDDRVGLVIKTNGIEERPDDYQAFLQLELEADPRLLVINRIMDDHEIKALIKQCDCFVSLHRSEGFGRGLAEAMYLGKPVIGTAYSGNMDFMSPENSCLVDFRLIPVGKDEYPFGTGQLWADADVEMAAHYMRQLVEDPKLARLKGNIAAQDIRRAHSFRAVGARYRKRLEALGLIDLLP